MIETTTCQHAKETKVPVGKDIYHLICQDCRQVRRVDDTGPQREVKLYKLGYINGKVVLPPPDLDTGYLNPKDKALLEELKKEEPAILPTTDIVGDIPAVTQSKPQPEIYVSDHPKTHWGIRKWRKTCKECDYSYTHDEILWCSSKKCPSRCPKKYRPTYRPKIEEAIEATASTPATETIESRNPGMEATAIVEKILEGFRVVIREMRESAVRVIPNFPDFNNKWPVKVKIAWFNTYIELVEATGKDEGEKKRKG